MRTKVGGGEVAAMRVRVRGSAARDAREGMGLGLGGCADVGGLWCWCGLESLDKPRTTPD